MQETDLSLMRYCGHFLIKAEGGAKNCKRESPLSLARQSFTVAFVLRKGYPHFFFCKSLRVQNRTCLGGIS